MTTDFKHIRTSILPFGYNEEADAFRFSLCVDLNPDYSEQQARDSQVLLKGFIKNFATAYFSEIRDGLQVQVNGKQVSGIYYCFAGEFLDKVTDIWKGFLASEIGVKEREECEKPVFAPSLSLDINSVVTMFGTAGNGVAGGIPEPAGVRKAAVAHYQQLLDQKKAANFETVLQKEYASLEASINGVAAKLDGIQYFSEDHNDLQNAVALKDTETGRHLSIYDSVNSMLDLWAYLDSNVVLQRQFGKTIDFEVPRAEMERLLSGGSQFSISFSGKTGSATELQWEHLKTSCRFYREHNLVLVEESPEVAAQPIVLEARNYDVGGKLVHLKAIKERYKDIFRDLNNPVKKESEKFLLRKELIRIDTAVLTLGINVYDSTRETIAQMETAALKARGAGKSVDTVYLGDVRKGYRIAARNHRVDSSGLTPLAQRVLSLKDKAGKAVPLPPEFVQQQVAISTDTGTHALLDDGSGTLSKKVIVDQAMMNWSGENPGFPSLFSNREDEENFEANSSEGSTDDSTRFVVEYFSKFLFENYMPRGVDYVGAQATNKYGKLNVGAKGVELHFEYTFPKAIDGKSGNKKLVFGGDYEVVLTPEYKNGWAVPFEVLSKLSSERSHFLNVSNFVFRRNEPVKPVAMQLQERLVDADRNPIRFREGESLERLVIRNFSKVDNDKIYRTKQVSVRHILPPAISFQHAFWHNKLFRRNSIALAAVMTAEESYRWYMKYHFPAEQDEDFMKWDEKGEWVREKTGKLDENDKEIFRKYTLEESIAGSTNMREFYPKDCRPNYLPDPLSSGFRLLFFRDGARRVKAGEYEAFEQLEFYFSGNYPDIHAWKLVLADYGNRDRELVSVDRKRREITIRLEKGEELFVSAMTILNADYEMELETYGNYNDFTRFGGNELLTPALEFSLVHATQRPLVRPKLTNLLRPDREYLEKALDATLFNATLAAHVEQTGSYRDGSGLVRYVEGAVPTGNLELYAKWEDYRDDPRHVTVDGWTPEQPVNRIGRQVFGAAAGESPATFETAIDLSGQLERMEGTLNRVAQDRNEFRNYAVDLKLSYDVKETKFIEKYFWVKNKSKFTGYYPKDWGTVAEGEVAPDSASSREYFNRLSAKPLMVRILNSRKPLAPVVSDDNITLVSVIEDRSGKGMVFRKASMNRLRFFFERGRLSSGKGERIGFVVNEPGSVYNDYLVEREMVSLVGRDIVSDTLKPYDGLFRNEEVLLTRANFVTNDPHDLKDAVTDRKSDDLESFFPKYVKELGLMTYLPKFDKKMDLWYLDVEMDINDSQGRELHSPFMRFAIVHYQEHSFNYNVGREADIAKDCRISEVHKSRYVYVMASRKIRLNYGLELLKERRKGSVKVGLEFDQTSLKQGHPETNRSKFYVLVRRRPKSELKWLLADRNSEGDGAAFMKLDGKERELAFMLYSKSDYQVLVLETEDWGNDNDTTFYGLIENRNSRIVHVNTFELDGDQLG